MERIGFILTIHKLFFQHENKRFNIRLEQAGHKTCVVVDYGDDENEDPSYDFFGNVASCRIRFPDLLTEQVQPLNIFTKGNYNRLLQFILPERERKL